MQLTEMMLAERPGVLSGRAAKLWLRSLPLSDARASHHAISALLAELDETQVPPRDRLEILETIRGHAALIEASEAGDVAAVERLVVQTTRRKAHGGVAKGCGDRGDDLTPLAVVANTENCQRLQRHAAATVGHERVFA